MVAASSAAEVVRAAGGWLFDRTMAGWDVTVLTPASPDGNALRILGARAIDLDSALGRPLPGPRAGAVAVEARLCETDARVRTLLQDVLDRDHADIRLWGEEGPERLLPDADPVRHQLSSAARAFKAHALTAISAPVPGDHTEVFHRTVRPVARA